MAAQSRGWRDGVGLALRAGTAEEPEQEPMWGRDGQTPTAAPVFEREGQQRRSCGRRGLPGGAHRAQSWGSCRGLGSKAVESL